MTFPRIPLRRAARILNGGTPPSGVAEFWDGDVPFVTPPDLNGLDGAQLDSTARTITAEGVAHSGLAPAGSVLLSTRAPIGHIGRLTSPAAFNQGCRALVPARNHEARFLAYSLAASRADMEARGLGTTFLELSGSSLAQVDVPLAPLDEQRAIADYLDRETAQIDAFIAKNEELITLVTERRASVLAAAMETGSNKMRLRQVLTVAQTGPFGTQLSASEYVDGGVPVINPSHIVGGVITPDISVSVRAERARELSRFRLFAEDIVLGRKGEVDKAALVDEESEGYLCGSDSMMLRPAKSMVHPSYLWWFLQSPPAHEQLERFAVGSTVAGLNQRTLRSVQLPVPSLEKQQKIIDDLDRSTAAIGGAVLVAKRSVELAKECRAALISAAVTGKIDVGVAA